MFTPFASLPEAQLNNTYVEFSFTPLNGQHFDLQSITFDVAAARVAAPQEQLALASVFTLGAVVSPASLGTGLGVDIGGQPTGPFNTFTFPLPDASYRDVSELITFRFYLYGSNPTSYVLLDNIELKGVALAAPTPTPGPTINITSVTRTTGRHFIVHGETEPKYVVTLRAAFDLHVPPALLGKVTADGKGVFEFDDDYGALDLTSRFYWVSAVSP
jgi:hypothetical protein